MSDSPRYLEHELDRRVQRSAAALRYLAYAIFAGAIAMATLNQLPYPEEGVFSMGSSGAPIQVRVSQFFTTLIPYAALAAVVLAGSAFIEIAMARLRVSRAANHAATTPPDPPRRGPTSEDLWRPPLDVVDG